MIGRRRREGLICGKKLLGSGDDAKRGDAKVSCPFRGYPKKPDIATTAIALFPWGIYPKGIKDPYDELIADQPK